MTKKHQIMLEKYKRATATRLEDVYTSFSAAKVNSLYYCKYVMMMMGGYDGRIVSANTFQFAYAFQYHNADDDKIHLMYITKAHNYDFAIEGGEK